MQEALTLAAKPGLDLASNHQKLRRDKSCFVYSGYRIYSTRTSRCEDHTEMSRHP